MGEQAAKELLTIGKFTACYGLKGWLKVHSYTDPEENFLDYDGWLVQRRGKLEPIEIDAGKRHGKGLVVHIKGVDDRTAAEAYEKLEVAVPADSLPELEEGDFYWRQLEGLEVWCRVEGEAAERVLLGTVDYLIETGANDVLVVKASEHSIDKRERLIPYLPGDVVTHVDIEAARIEVDWFIDD